MYQTLALSSSEVQRLRKLLESPEHAALRDNFPGLTAAVQSPLPDIRPVLKATLSALAMQAVLDAQHRAAHSPVAAALNDVRALHAALTAHLALVDNGSGEPTDNDGAHA